MLSALGHILFGFFGLTVLVMIAFAFSNNRRAVDWKLVITGISMQIGFAAAVLLGGRIESLMIELAPTFHFVWHWVVTRLAVALIVGFVALWIASATVLRDDARVGLIRQKMLLLAGINALLAIPLYGKAFDALGKGFVSLLEFNKVGSTFIFGKLLDIASFGFIFAFQVLPTIIFFAALMGVLYHLGVMQQIVKGMSWAITKVMNVSGAETTSVCASVFIGQTEAPLTIKPYLEKMTESELMTVMIGGMAHIAGGVLAAYVGLLGNGDPIEMAKYAKHLLAASIMAAPATLVLAKILIPETGQPLTRGSVRIEVERHSANVIDAAATGAGDGLKLALNVGAMLLAFIALIALLNAPLQALGTVQWGDAADSTINAWLSAGKPIPVNLSLQTLLGYLLSPIAWLIGVPWQDAVLVGGFIGEKVVLNEFVAYVDLSKNMSLLQEHSRVVAAYALCGFANFSSIAIQIGGIGGLAPNRRADLARLGLRAVLGGSLATFMTATIAGVLNQL